MATVRYLPPGSTQFLDPEDLRTAGDAFTAACEASAQSLGSIEPREAHEVLARSIMESVLSGERNAGRLTTTAIEHLQLERAAHH
jgi:hypothetical protein